MYAKYSRSILYLNFDNQNIFSWHIHNTNKYMDNDMHTFALQTRCFNSRMLNQFFFRHIFCAWYSRCYCKSNLTVGNNQWGPIRKVAKQMYKWRFTIIGTSFTFFLAIIIIYMKFLINEISFSTKSHKTS